MPVPLGAHDGQVDAAEAGDDERDAAGARRARHERDRRQRPLLDRRDEVDARRGHEAAEPDPERVAPLLSQLVGLFRDAVHGGVQIEVGLKGAAEPLDVVKLEDEDHRREE